MSKHAALIAEVKEIAERVNATVDDAAGAGDTWFGWSTDDALQLMLKVRALADALEATERERDEWMASSAGYGSDYVDMKVLKEHAEMRAEAAEAKLR